MSINNANVFSKMFFVEENFHNGKNIIWILQHNYQDIQFLKSKTKVYWSQNNKRWYVIDNRVNRNFLNLPLPLPGKSAIPNIDYVNQDAFLKMRDMLILKGYSPNTMRTYLNEFSQLLYLLKQYNVNNLSHEKIKSYLVYCMEKLGQSENQIHSRINALKFYFEKVLGRDKLFIGIPRPKKPSLLPKHLSESEIQKIIDVTKNPKHLLIIKMCYGMGLRVSEIANLKLCHIHSYEKKILISAGKGKKDRYVFMPETIIDDLKSYYKNYLPKIYLFEGNEGNSLSVRTIQAVFKNSMNKANIKRNVGIHCLRHSYATHLLEYGTDISHIQKLLGHNDIKTTLNYTKVTDKNLSKIVSPLDRIFAEKQ